MPGNMEYRDNYKNSSPLNIESSCLIFPETIVQSPEMMQIIWSHIKTMNRLSREKSPYLKHSAHQKIDWYPWSDEAFEKAKKEDKPVFLSTGAAWCHWCHVMAKECFENEEIVQF
jgi:thiol:disulfide interchange protein